MYYLDERNIICEVREDCPLSPVVEIKVHWLSDTSDTESIASYNRWWGNMARWITYQIDNPHTKQFCPRSHVDLGVPEVQGDFCILSGRKQPHTGVEICGREGSVVWRMAFTHSRLWVALVSHVQPTHHTLHSAGRIASQPREMSSCFHIRSRQINGLFVGEPQVY